MSAQPNPDPIATARSHLTEFVRTLRAHRIIIRLPYSSPLSLSSYAVKASLAMMVSDVNSISFEELYLLTSTFSVIPYSEEELDNLLKETAKFWKALQTLHAELLSMSRETNAAVSGLIERFFDLCSAQSKKYHRVLLIDIEKHEIQVYGWLT